MKKKISILLALTMLLSGCNADKRAQETTTEITTTTTADTTAAATATAMETTAVTTTPETISEAAVKTPVYDARATEYLTEIEKCEGFAETLGYGVEAAIADLDNNGSPELIIQITGMISLAAVFGIDESGAYRASVSENSIISESTGDVSYIGEPPVGCIIDREPQYFARYWSGGSCGGEGGWARLILSDREIKTEPLVQYVMYRNEVDYIYEYSGFENDEEYNQYISDYFAAFESVPIVEERIAGMSDSEKKTVVLQLLDEYFTEKLYQPQMTYCEIEHYCRQDADLLPQKPQDIRTAKLNYDDSGAVKVLDKDIENIAMDCLRSSESYTKTADALKKSKGKYYIGEVELTARTDENYEPLITVTQSYSMDIDGNGKEEHFVILRYLDIEPEFIPYETDCCVFVSDKGEAELIIPKSVELRMGIIQGDGIRHIVIKGGCNNTTSFFSIYSLKDSKSHKELEEWNGTSISDGEIIFYTQMDRYCVAYDLDREEYVFYSF